MNARGLILRLGPVTKPLAGRRFFPLWAIMRHTGRTSGKAYAIPIVTLRTPEGFIIPLPFGNSTQWLKNLVAAGRGSIRFAGQEYAIAEPRTIDYSEARDYLPRWARFMSDHVVRIRQWVLVRRASS